MQVFLIPFLKINLTLVACYMLWRFLIVRISEPSTQRYFLISSLFFSVLSPFINLRISEPILDINQSLSSLAVHSASLNSVSIDTYEINWVVLLTSIYAIFSVALLSRLIISFVKINRLRKTSIARPLYFEVPNSKAAFSFLSTIFIGDGIPEEDRIIILEHEKIHVKKRHSLDFIICKLIEVIFWINPIAYLYKPSLERIHEYEADEESCKDTNKYINVLLKQNFEIYDQNFIHSFNSKHLKSRIMRIKNQPKMKFKKTTIILSSLFFLFILNVNQKAHSNNSIQENKGEISGEVDKLAEYPGGTEALLAFLSKEIVYPESAKKKGIEATVYIKFKIDTNGKCSDYRVLKEVDKELEANAIEALKKMKDWKAAEKNGKKVATEMTIPIKYALNGEKDEKN